jgi:hypothetical protein
MTVAWSTMRTLRETSAVLRPVEIVWLKADTVSDHDNDGAMATHVLTNTIPDHNNCCPQTTKGRRIFNAVCKGDKNTVKQHLIGATKDDLQHLQVVREFVTRPTLSEFVIMFSS